MLSTKSIGLFSSLREIEPEVWRCFVVPGSMSLHDLHEVLQVLYGWVDYHLYNFTLDDRYEKLRPDLDQHRKTEVIAKYRKIFREKVVQQHKMKKLSKIRSSHLSFLG